MNQNELDKSCHISEFLYRLKVLSGKISSIGHFLVEADPPHSKIEAIACEAEESKYQHEMGNLK